MQFADVFKVLYISYFTDKVCYPPYGCFSKDFPFNSSFIPLPENPDTLNTTYHLYNRLNPNGQIISNDFQSLNGTKKLIVIAHGFIEDSKVWWIGPLKDELLNVEDSDVIVIDWKRAARIPYQQAISNIRVTSAQTSHFLRRMFNKTDLRPSNVHLIGFSLGAHLMGHIGRDVFTHTGVKVKRITALDPAGPLFEDSVKDFRLDPSDGMFVDAIHTDSKTIFGYASGTLQSFGHTDFYPNGGYYQPGCKLMKIELPSTQGFYDQVTCNHYRAVKYFITSIKNKKSFKSYKCGSFYRFKNGACAKRSIASTSVNTMGYYTDCNAKGKFYLLTNTKEPYSVRHYTVEIYTGDKMFADTYGGVELQLKSVKGKSFVRKDSGQFFDRKSVTRYMMHSSKDLGRILKIDIKHSSGLFFKDDWYVKKVVVKSQHPNKSYYGCVNKWLMGKRYTVLLSTRKC